MVNKSVIRILTANRLKITPQRVAILEVILSLDNHPTVEIISEYLRLAYPNITLGTIYNTLETFSKKGIINKIPTYFDPARYDAVKKKHHHLYGTDSERIEDYFDDDINNILKEYFRKKKIPDFNIEDIRLQIIGRFTDEDKKH